MLLYFLQDRMRAEIMLNFYADLLGMCYVASHPVILELAYFV